ncbi:methyltransferase domain-containing protein [Rhodocytophaga rosea]|uniref:Methyltransferase domain-containing protein n=1 Tax=Rhodocytophaga rosea TaxID=2704465 RepID=A0A6C0GRQ2_9BACT|nr:methyltransferase domain-containing protein [Rhodocytophaga rosea]QHT70544.1 methyltransferase domain-containing protein [Rhodocytophaga rosea]
MKLLNLGCGNRYHKSWTNIDFYSANESVLSHDLTQGIPFDNDTFDVVYHSHVLEHFSKTGAAAFLKECFRVLKPNGIIRIAVPDLESIARIYLQQLESAYNREAGAEANYDWIVLEMYDQTVRNRRGGDMADYIFQGNLANESFVYARHGLEAKNLRKEFLNAKDQNKHQNTTDSLYNRVFNFGAYKRKLIKLLLGKEYISYEIGKFRMSGEIHQWMYDRFSLSRLLLQTGFKNPVKMTAFSSSFPEWNTFELESKEGEIFKPDSLYMEAFKIN